MAKLPKKLRLEPYNYTVDTNPQKLLAESQIVKDGLDGITNTGNQSILIDVTVHGDRQATTLAHEVSHVLLEDLQLDAELEERIVRVFGNRWVAALRNNRQLVEFLLEGPD